MTRTHDSAPVTRSYYVDEAGDAILFSRRKRMIVGKEGCSSYFMLGMIDVTEPDALAGELEALRNQLLADPYFKDVPSMQRVQNKTAVAFHAKDDLSEVRRSVFELIMKHGIRFYAVIRDKNVIAHKVREHNKKARRYRYHPNQLYDRCVSRLFKERLHQHDAYTIHFARRGSFDRTEALRRALETARHNFRRSKGINSTSPIEIIDSNPVEVACLQAADYFLWALQRFYERSEERFLNLLWPQVGLIHDVDDTRATAYGEYYSQSKQLTLEARAKK